VPDKERQELRARQLVPGKEAQEQRPRFCAGHGAARASAQLRAGTGKDAEKERDCFVPGKDAQEQRLHSAPGKDARKQENQGGDR
jgi:hypothetical protein